MSVSGGDGAQPPEGNGARPAEPGQGPEERPEKPAAKPDGGVRRLRVAGYALLVVAVLAALVPILGLAAQAPSSPQRQAAESSRVAEQTTTRKTTTKPTTSKTTKKKKPSSTKPKSSRKRTSEPAVVGPKINSDSNEQADTMLTRRKLVVGGIALGLLVIVIWGRRARNVRRKKMDSQSKGGK